MGAALGPVTKPGLTETHSEATSRRTTGAPSPPASLEPVPGAQGSTGPKPVRRAANYTSRHASRPAGRA